VYGAPQMLAFPPIDLPPARSKLLWVLVGCFLLANAGIFLLTQQQSQTVNKTLIAITSSLVEAMAKGPSGPAVQEEPPASPVRSGEPESVAPAPTFDTSQYQNSHELGIANARRLVREGDYVGARRTLFLILANQDRSMPLSPEQREDIDYLIALTYYDQGRSIGAEHQGAQR
jgi:hypothetical protein